MKKATPAQPWPVRDNVARILEAVLAERSEQVTELFELPSPIRSAIIFIKAAIREKDVEKFFAAQKILANKLPSSPAMLSPKDRRTIEHFMNPPRRERGRPPADQSSKRADDTEAMVDADAKFLAIVSYEVMKRCAATMRSEMGIERLSSKQTKEIALAIKDEIFDFIERELDANDIRERYAHR